MLDSIPIEQLLILSVCFFMTLVSMVDADLFDKLNIIAKRVRRNDKPFGGMQVRNPSTPMQLCVHLIENCSLS